MRPSDHVRYLFASVRDLEAHLDVWSLRLPVAGTRVGTLLVEVCGRKVEEGPSTLLDEPAFC